MGGRRDFAVARPEGEDDGPLYLAALALEQDDQLSAEMAEWEEAMVEDGLTDLRPIIPTALADDPLALPHVMAGEGPPSTT